MALTTIKVPVELRDRITGGARSEKKTVAGFLADLVAARERAQQLEAVRAAYAALPEDDDYAAETREWDTTLRDGLPDA